MRVAIRKILKSAGLVLLSLLVGMAGLVGTWLLRPNEARVDPRLRVRVSAVLESRRHNSNADLIFWRGHYYAVHQNSRYHFASKTSRLLIYRSLDAVHWEKAAEMATGEDLRDPKFAVIRDRLFLYALANVVWTAAPYRTLCSASDDGKNWSPWEIVRPDGWLLWRPKTFDDKTWYAAGYWKDLGKSALFKSGDGRNWAMVSLIHEGEKVNETALEFLPDERLVAAARLEARGGDFGDNRAGTLVAVSEPPYHHWSSATNRVTRLDGPLLFQHQGRIYALGRYQPERDSFLFKQGSILSRKRTSLFSVVDGRLIRLSDLPSAGDTSYAGICLRGDAAFLAYYSSALNRDYPWIIGMLGRSSVRVLRLDVAGLASLAEEKTNAKDPDPGFQSPLQNYLVFLGLVLISLLVFFGTAKERRKKGVSS